MTRILTMSAVVLLCAVPARADVTITQTMSVEGGMAKMMGGMTPRMVTRIKGLASRMEIEVMGQTMATITDLATQQFILLDGKSRTAQVFGAGGAAPPGAVPAALPKIDMSFKATGQSRAIEGVQCDEHTFTMAMNMAEAGASSQMPAEAMAAMKDVRMAMAGSVWIATSGPGVADYVRFQKAAADAHTMAALMGMKAGQSPAGMEQLMAASAAAPGLPYLTEMTMTFEGTGKVVEMMKQMGPIQMTHRITAVSTDPVPDEMFQVPEGYTIQKQ